MLSAVILKRMDCFKRTDVCTQSNGVKMMESAIRLELSASMTRALPDGT